MRSLRVPLVALICLSVAPHASAQGGPPPTNVEFTEARALDMKGRLRLPGTVVSPLETVVTAEVAGMMIAVEVREGDRVEKGQVLARLRPVYYRLQLDEARASLVEAEARLDLAERNRQRSKELLDDAVVSQQDFDNAESELLAWSGRVAQTQARIAQLELALELCRVRAPFAGFVTAKRTEVGRWLQSGGEVAGLVSLDALEMEIDVPERYFPAVGDGLRATVRVDVVPGEWSAKVTRRVPRADLESRTFPVRVRLEKAGGDIAVGMLGSVELPLGASGTATVVPKDALVRDGDAEIVYRMVGEDRVEAVSVTSGEANGSWIAVRGGIRPGDRVVVKGNERIADGQPVKARAGEYALP